MTEILKAFFMKDKENIQEDINYACNKAHRRRSCAGSFLISYLRVWHTQRGYRYGPSLRSEGTNKSY